MDDAFKSEIDDARAIVKEFGADPALFIFVKGADVHTPRGDGLTVITYLVTVTCQGATSGPHVYEGGNARNWLGEFDADLRASVFMPRL